MTKEKFDSKLTFPARPNLQPGTVRIIDEENPERSGVYILRNISYNGTITIGGKVSHETKITKEG